MDAAHLGGQTEAPREDFWWQRKIEQLEEALADARRRAEVAEAKTQGTRSYVPQDIAGDVYEFLTAAGCGKPGTPNTLWAMTKEACDKLAAAEKQVKELMAERDDLRRYDRPITEKMDGHLTKEDLWRTLRRRDAQLANAVKVLTTAEADALERAAVIAEETAEKNFREVRYTNIAAAIRALKPEGWSTVDLLERAAVKVEGLFADRSVGRAAADAIRSLKSEGGN